MLRSKFDSSSRSPSTPALVAIVALVLGGVGLSVWGFLDSTAPGAEVRAAAPAEADAEPPVEARVWFQGAFGDDAVPTSQARRRTTGPRRSSSGPARHADRGSTGRRIGTWGVPSEATPAGATATSSPDEHDTTR